MTRNLSILALALVSSSAFATCYNGATNYPECNNNTPPKQEGGKGQSTNNGGGGGGGGAGVGVGIAGADSSAAAEAAAKANSAANATGTGGKASSSANGGSATVKGGNTSGTVSGTQSMSNTGNSRATGGNASQGQGQSSRNTLSASAGNGAGASAGAGAGSGNRTSNTTNLDASDRSSSSYNAVAWAPVIHGAAAAPLASAGLIAIPGVCGPRVRAVTTQVYGVRFGFFGGQESVALGYTQDVAPYLNEDGTPGDPFITDEKSGYVYGTQFTILAAALGTSTSNSLSLGGFSNGNGGQGGVASSGGMQQIAQHVIVSPCIVGRVTPPAPKTVFVEVPAKKGRR